MKEFESNTNKPIEKMTVEACSGEILDTFLNSRLDGAVGKKRRATIEALLASYQQSDPEILDSLFERAYDYGREIDRLSLSSELRERLTLSARRSIPIGIVEENPDGRKFLSQNPVSQLMDGDRDASKYDWPQAACLMGVSAGILSLQSFGELLPTEALPVLDNNIFGDLLAVRNSMVEKLTNNPEGLIDSLLPEARTREQYEACLFVTRNLLSGFVGGRIAKLIQAKCRSMVSYDRVGGYQKYSQWAVLWENPQGDKVKDLFPEIPMEQKRQFYEKASDLARIQLTRDVLQRDLRRGSVPPEIMKFVNEYLLYCLDKPSLNTDLRAFVEFVKTQVSLFEQTQLDIADGKFEAIADYRGTALKVDYVPKTGGEAVTTPSLPEKQNIGQLLTIELGVRTLEFLEGYKIKYPQSVVNALGILFNEYNQAFKPLIGANREWNTDYQYCFQNGVPTNCMVQIDMVGLDREFLERAKNMDPGIIADELRGKIFEIENSIADYGYLRAVGVDIRPVLDSVRQQFQRPIALLATTQRKYGEMRVAEFGEEREGEMVSDEKVMQLSGFDVFWGPEEFKKYLEENNGKCDYLLYVRSSAPKTQLRDPRAREAQPLLSGDQFREVIKANAITFNIDDPNIPVGGAQRINDTKLYMPQIGMGYPIYCIADLETDGFRKFLREIGSENPIVRVKPALESYGGYGQLRGTIDSRFIRDLNSEMRARGPYILQDEKPNSRIIDENGIEYLFIDRNYLAWCNGGVVYLGGERTLMPVSSQEAKSGRVHANEDAILANISLRQL